MNPTLVLGHGFVNLTPHPLSWRTRDGELHTVPPLKPGEHTVVVETRAAHSSDLTHLGGIICQEKTFGDIRGLPSWLEWECRPNVVFIVGGMVLSAIKEGRLKDSAQSPQPREIWLTYVAPATGPTDGAERNSAGQVEWVTRWDVV